MPAHTVKAFDEELGELNAGIARMGDAVSAQLRAAMESIVARDRERRRRMLGNVSPH